MQSEQLVKRTFRSRKEIESHKSSTRVYSTDFDRYVTIQFTEYTGCLTMFVPMHFFSEM